MKQRLISIFFPALAFILVGATLLLDGLGVSIVDGFDNIWFATLLIAVALGMFVSMLVRRKSEYISLATIVFVVGTMLFLMGSERLALSFGRLWPMLLLAVALAFLSAYIFRGKKKIYLKLSLFLLILSVALLVGSLFDMWRIVAPLVLLFVGGVMVCVALFSKDESIAKGEYSIPSISIVGRKKELDDRNKEDKENK